MMNNLLAIETSSDVTGVSLIVNGEPIDTSEDIIRSKNLAVWIYDILKKNSMQVQNLDGIAVDIGPGGFTSLRAGLSIAKGLAMSSSLPMIPVNLFNAVAFDVGNLLQETYIIAMHAYGKKFFLQSFNKTASVSDASISSDLSDLKGKTVVGYKLDSDVDCKLNFTPSSVMIGLYAYSNFDNLLTDNISSLECLYIGSNF